MIVAHALTEATVDDATEGIDLIGVAVDLASVTGDAAYDSVAFDEAASARDRAITSVETLGRRQWTKASGSHQQARVEHACFRYTSIIGDGLRARSRGGRRVDASLACSVLNRMTERGRPE